MILEPYLLFEHVQMSEQERTDLHALAQALLDAGIHGTLIIPEPNITPASGGTYRVVDEKNLFVKLYVEKDLYHSVIDILEQDRFLFSSVHTEPSIIDYESDDWTHKKGVGCDI